MPNFKFNLGDEVKDSITDFTGIVINRSQWLHNCNSYGVQSTKMESGKPVDRMWFDEPQLVFIKASTITPKRDTGGDAKTIPSTNR